MMFDWLKHITNDYPDFWRAYLSRFDSKPTRLVVLSTKATGPDYKKDVILSIAAFGIANDQVLIGDSFEVVLLQYVFNHDHGLPNDFITETQLPKLVEAQAIQQFVEFIGNATLVGHRIDQDMEMINEALARLHCGRLKNQALDVEVMFRTWKEITAEKHFSLDELSAAFKIPLPEKVSQAEEAYTIALLFLKLKTRLGLQLP
jgi:DNA polymerase III subunit epsilon